MLGLLVVMLPFFLLTLKPDVHGQTPLQLAGVRAGWRRARMGRSHLYRSGPLGQTPHGSYQLRGSRKFGTISVLYTDDAGRRFPCKSTVFGAPDPTTENRGVPGSIPGLAIARTVSNVRALCVVAAYGR